MENCLWNVTLANVKRIHETRDFETFSFDSLKKMWTYPNPQISTSKLIFKSNFLKVKKKIGDALDLSVGPPHLSELCKHSPGPHCDQLMPGNTRWTQDSLCPDTLREASKVPTGPGLTTLVSSTTTKLYLAHRIINITTGINNLFKDWGPRCKCMLRNSNLTQGAYV